MKSIYLTPLLAFAFGLVGCQGQDILKHHTNPLQSYQDLQKNSVPANGPRAGRTGGAATPGGNVDSTQYACVQGFEFDLTPDDGSHLATFTEDVSTSITLHVHSLADFGGAWDVKAIAGKMPVGSEFKRLDQQGSNGTYVFTWKPAKSGAVDLVNQILALNYTSDGDARCNHQAHRPQMINLVVKKNDGQPSFQISTYGDLDYGQKTTIDIALIDPSASADTPPTLTKTFVADTTAGEDDLKVLDAREALLCPDQKREFKDGAWIFHCSFDPRLIPNDQLQTVLNKDIADDADLWIAAQGRNQQWTPTTPIKVHVRFHAMTTVASADQPKKQTVAKAKVVSTNKKN